MRQSRRRKPSVNYYVICKDFKYFKFIVTSSHVFLFVFREETQNRAKELQAALDETEQRLTESQDVALRVKGLEEQLELKTIELKEEMDDRDKAEDRVLRLTENLSVRDKELEALRHEVMKIFFSILPIFYNVNFCKIHCR